MGVNIDRQGYKYTSRQLMKRRLQLRKPFLTKDFRQALNFAFDRTSYSAQINGKEGAPLAVRNLFVKPDFVSAGEKTFGDLVTEKMAAYGDDGRM